MSTSPDSSSTHEEPRDPHRSEPEVTQPSPTIETPVPSVESSTSTLPPEAQGETNGGPLGCCLGVMVGLLLSLVVVVVSRFYSTELAQIFTTSLSTVVRITTVVVALIAVIICGYFGWKIGKRAYREYDPPTRSRRGRNISSTQSTKSRR